MSDWPFRLDNVPASVDRDGYPGQEPLVKETYEHCALQAG